MLNNYDYCAYVISSNSNSLFNAKYGSPVGANLFSELEMFFNECSDNIYHDWGFSSGIKIQGLERWTFNKYDLEWFLDVLSLEKKAVRNKLGAIMNKYNVFKTFEAAFKAALKCIKAWIAECDPRSDKVIVDWM